jgi:hypothetical protein
VEALLEMLRIPHCVDSRLTDSGKVVSPTHLPRFTLQKHYFSAAGTHFYWSLSEPQGLVRPEGLSKLKEMKVIHLISSQTRDFPACSIIITMLHIVKESAGLKR